MRLIPALCGLAALAIAPSAFAVTLTPVSFSPEFQTALTDDLGVREGEYLQADVEDAVRTALARRGVDLSSSGGSIDITIVDADPNRPTMQQLSNTPGLDAIRSFSVGGAELHAVVRRADGAVTEVNHRHYNSSLADFQYAPPASAWSEARRSIRRFAEKVADAYVAQSGR